MYLSISPFSDIARNIPSELQLPSCLIPLNTSSLDSLSLNHSRRLFSLPSSFGLDVEEANPAHRYVTLRLQSSDVGIN